MNMSVLALMLGIAAAFIGRVIYALAYGHPVLLVALAAIGGLAFAPWHKSR